MEPTNSKIVSLHLDGCKGGCRNASACYFLKRSIVPDSINKTAIKRILLMNGYTIHDAVCELIDDNLILLTSEHYNITVSNKILQKFDKKKELLAFKNQISVSIYSYKESVCSELRDIQKMYLIKDDKTLQFFMRNVKNERINKIHFCIDQEYLESSGKLPEIIKTFSKKATGIKSMDTCLSSFVVNGKCPYEKNNYVDVSADLSVRRCPFVINGTKLNTLGNSILTAISNSLKLESNCDTCYYHKFFKEIKK